MFLNSRRVLLVLIYQKHPTFNGEKGISRDDLMEWCFPWKKRRTWVNLTASKRYVMNKEWNMGARRYGISPRVSNSIAHEWTRRTSEVSSWRREGKFISTGNHVLFLYYINTIGLYWQEESTLLMNEKVVKCVGDKAWNERMRWRSTKQTLGVTFTSQSSQLLTFSLPIEKYFSILMRTTNRLFWIILIKVLCKINFCWRHQVQLRSIRLWNLKIWISRLFEFFSFLCQLSLLLLL